MEIRDWWVARELDIHAAVYLHEEEIKREDEREKRDRDFWLAMFGGKSNTDDMVIEETMAPLGNR